MKLVLASKVVEDVLVVAGAAVAALSQSHDPATVATAVAAAPAVRGLLAGLLSKGQERSLVGVAALLHSLLRGAPKAGAGDTPAGDPPAAQPPAPAAVQAAA